MLGLVSSIIVILSILWIVASYSRVLYLRSRMPPGPFPYPIVGNIGQVPTEKPYVTFEKWSKDYNSPLITLWTGNRPTVIANDCWSASDLMDKRANIYSSRPVSYLAGDMLDDTENNQTNLVYGDKWRLHRRITHSAVGSQAVRGYRTFQGNESKILARDILDGNDFVFAIERYACSVASIIGWGRRIRNAEDDLARLALSFVQTGASLTTPAQHLAESYPWMCKLPRWMYPLPSALWEDGQRLLKYFYALTVEGSRFPEDSFSKRLINEQLELKLSPKEIASLTGNLIGGGVDTTTTTILVFIFAMCAFPRVQHKAQEEIDRVLAGEPHPPRWEDEESLPYCRALLTEIFRWRSAIALGGPPHAPTQDDIYNGMLIPAGTTIIGNLWAIHRNPRDYPNPDEVRPERFLDEAQRRPNPSKRGIFTFGWGRRVCSGQPLAEQGVWFTMVELLWAFRMRSVDDQGNDKKLDIFAFNNSPAPRPLPFNVEFTPRSEKIEEIIRQEASRAELELRKYDIASKVTLDNN
ncbi:cytochrome p450 [Colletotrichum chrysophilum]|uniref:Cytochrome p450 n=1 Tax=Colletotrichum chrysophilum TaxID=1836956 RepID=A0AAD9AJE0_9PEZI|nr:cytochrome p450 [Colletotrichum chrysophilum]